jgi:hypothetical protein
MQLPFLKNATLGDTQAAFPQLKLAFFSKTHQKNKGNNAKFLISDHKSLLGDLPGFRAEGLLSIEPHLRTWEVEKMIEDETGLHVQIFRKSGNLWLETSKSDDLTLAEQIEHALLEEQYKQPIVDPMDYREMD